MSDLEPQPYNGMYDPYAVDLYVTDDDVHDIDPRIFTDGAGTIPEHWKSQNFAEFLMRIASSRFISDEASVYVNAYSDQVIDLQGNDGYTYILQRPRKFDEVVRDDLMQEFGSEFPTTITRKIFIGVNEERTEYTLVDRKIIRQTFTLPQIRDKKTKGEFDKDKAEKSTPQELSETDTIELIRIIALSKASQRLNHANKELRSKHSPEAAKILGEASLHLTEVS